MWRDGYEIRMCERWARQREARVKDVTPVIGERQLCETLASHLRCSQNSVKRCPIPHFHPKFPYTHRFNHLELVSSGLRVGEEVTDNVILDLVRAR